MHELEKQALEDPFLSDALEGYAAHKEVAGPQLSLLQRRLEEHIARHRESKNVFYFTWQRISIAAAAGLMFLSAGILFWLKAHNYEGRTIPAASHVEVRLTSVENIYTHSPSIDRQGRSNIPAPVGGWKRYREYLNSGLRLNSMSVVSGKVTVAFNIGQGGSPKNFRVVRGLNTVLNKEVVRLIEEGPRWQAEAGENSDETSLTVEFYK